VRYTASALLTVGIILLLLTAGCADVTSTQKVGDFGTTFGASSEEQKAIDWFKATYGDPLTNNDKPARFVEPLVTTGVDSHPLPVDKVVMFPQSGGSIYFFVIYDNFKKGDSITVSWLYVENGRVVTTVEKQASGDFGRFIVEFQKPDSGWGKGKQKLTISGNGATASVDFTIGDTLKTIPLPYTPGSGSSGASSEASTGSSSLTGRVTPSVTAFDTGGLGMGRIQRPTLIRTIPPTLHEGSGAPAPQIDTNNDVNNCGGRLEMPAPLLRILSRIVTKGSVHSTVSVTTTGTAGTRLSAVSHSTIMTSTVVPAIISAVQTSIVT